MNNDARTLANAAQAPEDNAVKLDYTLKTCKERVEIVNKLLEQTPKEKLTKRYLEFLSDYILSAEKDIGILTPNRLVTIARRETSYEGLVEKFENGEDGVHNLITEGKGTLLTHKLEITKEDLEEVKGLTQVQENIKLFEELLTTAQGRDKYVLKKALIDARKDQYALKGAAKQPISGRQASVLGGTKIDLSENCWLDENLEPQSDGIVSFFYPHHVSALLNNYTELAYYTKKKYASEIRYFIEDFYALTQRALQETPVCKAITNWKFEGLTNLEIVQKLQEELGVSHTPEYISKLWCVKIPKIIAQKAKEEYVIWYFTIVKKGYFKTCSSCGERKLAHPYFYTRNKNSKDGWYCQCKVCRNKRARERKREN